MEHENHCYSSGVNKYLLNRLLNKMTWGYMVRLIKVDYQILQNKDLLDFMVYLKSEEDYTRQSCYHTSDSKHRLN